MEGNSEIPGFYKMSVRERLDLVRRMTGLTEEEAKSIYNTGGLPVETADRMIENVVGGITIPMGIGVNFKVNGRDYLVPMALEEPSVVAAASNAAKMARTRGGFTVTNTGPVMYGQIQVVNVPAPEGARTRLFARKEEILKKANEQDPMLVSLGGGAKDIRVRVLSSLKGPMLVVELIVNTGDAMGANAVNTMAEAVAPMVEEMTGGRVFLRIISNLADRRLVRATAVFARDAVGGDDHRAVRDDQVGADRGEFVGAAHQVAAENGGRDVLLLGKHSLPGVGGQPAGEKPVETLLLLGVMQAVEPFVLFAAGRLECHVLLLAARLATGGGVFAAVLFQVVDIVQRRDLHAHRPIADAGRGDHGEEARSGVGGRAGGGLGTRCALRARPRPRCYCNRRRRTPRRATPHGT